MQQLISVRRFQDLIKRVALLELGRAGGHREQMQIVIAEHAQGALAERFDEAQHLQRLRPAVDQVAGEPQAVARGIETQPFQQLLQGRVAALHIADGVNRHQPARGGRPSCAAMSMVALIRACIMPGSCAECPALGMMSSRASGQARTSSQALASGHTMS